MASVSWMMEKVLKLKSDEDPDSYRDYNSAPSAAASWPKTIKVLHGREKLASC